MTPSPKSRVSRPPAPSYRRTSFDLAADLKHALALAAVYEDRPMVAIVEEALVLWMRQHGYEFEDGDGPIRTESLAPCRPVKSPPDRNRPTPND